jgi:hypothetical protein
VLFVPNEDGEKWSVRLPLVLPVHVPGLDECGECTGLERPDHDALDRLMLQRHCGYRRRLHENGVVELAAGSTTAAVILCEWVADLIARSRAS